METRQLVAYALLALLVVALAIFAWQRATRVGRRLRRHRADKARWNGPTPGGDAAPNPVRSD